MIHIITINGLQINGYYSLNYLKNGLKNHIKFRLIGWLLINYFFIV